MDRSMCVVCQDNTNTEIRCPKSRPARFGDLQFLNNISKFRKIDALPISENITPDELYENSANGTMVVTAVYEI